ncbi:MFS transporter [Chlorobium phaeovibrioides]|uniref:MFS transporter n=1 Tax=Chlorobium phaeovibrioides TaxID=1094 RepID=A0A432AUK8_CHLPH|nr:MFS transporter [Chlorobium phaeovibrioides]KAA6231720.1 MFS transporter [Chlorobium phaeovibrioides]MWV54759.1 MFS transporter [Chlorobium phaeovibrioides]RTY36758.1 MFS transporter [Chlorobium phaeovibrioides]RTY38174.1 MFS transporter [Chlorobium phaeovibrioides]
MQDSSAPHPGSRISKKLLEAFPAFGSLNFRRYFPGQVVSMVGTWMQMVAQGWLVLELTDSAFDVGLVAAASTLPTLFLSLFGGVIVDRYPRRTILLWTQTAAMMLAFILGIFVLTGTVTMPVILILSFLLGCVNALNVPALQAFLSEMVEREHLSSAIAMNSAIYNGSRVIGPAIAGFIIAAAGTGAAFIANGFSFLAVIVSLLLIRSAGMLAPEGERVHPIEAIREGLRYSLNHPIIRTIVIFIAIISIFAWSYVTMLPVIAKRSFQMDATGLGYLYGVSGLGSVLGTIFVSMYSRTIDRMVFISGGTILFSLSLAAFTWTSWLPLAYFFLFLCGLGLVAAVATMSATLQGTVDDRYRGRVMSLYMMVFMGFMPIGNLEVGWLSEQFGTGPAIRIGCLVTLIAAIAIIFYSPRVRADYDRYRKAESG